MDDRRFDLLAKTLAGTSRRSVLGGLLAAALAPFGAAAQGKEKDKRAGGGGAEGRGAARGSGPGAEGPCSPNPEDERCKKDADCCTRLCDGRKGRCRCARAGQRCTQDRNCCVRAPNGPLSCQGAAGAKTCRPATCAEGCADCETCRRGSCVPDAAEAGKLCGGDKVCTTDGVCEACGPGNACPGGRCCHAGGCVADGAACGAGEVCDGGSCRALRCGDPGAPCRVFITPEIYDGAMTPSGGTPGATGLAAADAHCRRLANAAELDGVYRAWLSTAASSPKADQTFTKASGPYVLVNGTEVAASWDDLTRTGRLASAINVFPDGRRMGNVGPVWTNTLRDGEAGGYASNGDCKGWTSATADHADALGNYGNSITAVPFWTREPGSRLCSWFNHLYCFEQGGEVD